MKTAPASATLMFFLGLLTWLAAAYYGWWAYHIETTVAGDPSAPAYGAVANLQMMHFQLTGFIVAGALAIVGTLWIGFAAVIAHADDLAQSRA